MEKGYRKKLQERTFEPSKDSWKKLDDRLTAFEYKSKAKKWQFFKYAASILLLISVGLYFNKEDEKIDVIIVEQPVIKLKELKKDLLKPLPEKGLVEVSNEKKVNQLKTKAVTIKSPKLQNSQKIGRIKNLKMEQLVVENQF